MTLKSTIFLRSFFCLTTLSLASCGGGSDNDDDRFSGAANVTIQAFPNSIDTGDRFEVTIDISNINPDGVALKVRFPTELQYVPQSSFIEPDGEDNEEDLTPDVITADSDNNYLVYYLSEDDFGDEGKGKVILQLAGNEEVKTASIEVDPDVDDPAVNNATEFNIDTPEFVAEDSVVVTVIGD